MSATHVRRGASGRAGSRKGGSRVAVPKKIAAKLPVKQAQANKLAGWAFGLFVVAIAGVALIALDVPAKVGIAAGEVLIIMESMKMEIPVEAPVAGVCRLAVAEGANVQEGELLATIE